MSPSKDTTPHQKHIYLLTHPRTCSNLLTKILSLPTQPTVAPHPVNGYFFLAIANEFSNATIREADPRTWTPEQRSQLQTSWSAGAEKLSAYVRAAEDSNTRAFVKEHTYFICGEGGFSSALTDMGLHSSSSEETANEKWTVSMPGFPPGKSAANPTIFSDSFLKIWEPIFLIRHPALTFASQWRALRDVDLLYPSGVKGQMGVCYEFFFSFAWERRLYDFFSSLDPDMKPIVVDGDDIISSPAIIAQLCERTGLDEGKLIREWSPWSEEQKAKMSGVGLLRFTTTIAESKGVLREKMAPVGGIDIDAEAEKWKVEFGVEEAGILERIVRREMVDYEYLKERKLNG